MLRTDYTKVLAGLDPAERRRAIECSRERGMTLQQLVTAVLYRLDAPGAAPGDDVGL